MAHLDLNGTRLHTQTLGQGSTVVMIHGLLLGNMATWYFGAAAQLARSRQVMLYDLRGHGLSAQATSGYDLATMTTDLEALLEGRPGQVALVGHSYGALIALQFALRHPQRVSRLVLVEGPLPPSRGLELAAFQAQEPQAMLQALPEPLRALLAKDQRQAQKLLGRLRFLLEDTDLLARLEAEDDIDDARLRALTMPALLIYGRKSQLEGAARRLRDALPQAELSWLDGGHYLPSETPVALGHRIGDFFS